MIEGIFVDGLIFSIMALGILISFRILDLADLTCDGSVVTGAATAGVLIINGWPVTLALLMSFVAGVLCGVITALIHTKLKVPGLLAGILTMTMLYSVNLRILGNKANLPLLKVSTVYTNVARILSFLPAAVSSLIITLLITVLIKVLMDMFFRSDLGLCIGAMGGNEQTVISMAINPTILKVIGLGLSNGLIGLSGGLLTQYQGFADVNLGQGMVVQGLAAIMIGEFIFSTNKISLITIRAIIGSIIYKALLFYGRKYGYLIGITPNDFKLLTGLLVILSLAVAKLKSAQGNSLAKYKVLKGILQKKETR